MGYQRSDYRYGGPRSRERGYRGEDRTRSGRDDWDRTRSPDDDRGFFERGVDELRSWFGDDEAERRREMDERRQEREYGRGGMRRSGDEGYYGSNYDRPARGFTQEDWDASGYGGSYAQGRRFDRIDPGSTGTHGAHPMTAPVSGYGSYASDYGSSARNAAIAYGGRRDPYDRHYWEWRNRQLDALDRDYDEYRRENQSRFEQEFGSWREKRQTQRQSLGRVTEHMEVIGSDGEHVGTVDKVRGDRIILTKSDENAGGHHHSIPCGWITQVEDKVTINKSAEEAMKHWRDEETRRALFEREDQWNEGPHALGRSFSGTY